MSESDDSSTSVLQLAENDQNGQDTDNDYEHNEDSVIMTKRGKAKIYNEYQRYSSYHEAVNIISDMFENSCWGKKNLKKGKGANSDKQYFKCSNCSKMLYIEKPKTHSGAIIFIENIDHDHDHGVKQGIPDKTKEVILKKYFEEKLPPKKIMRWLRDHLNEGYVEVDSIQLNNFIQNQKKKKKDFIKLDLAGLKDWVESKSNIPESEDELFTVSKWLITPEKIDFKVFFTTKRLISYTRNAKFIAADATYKLTWLNYPVLLCGTTDFNKAFHPFGVMLSKHETHEEFSFMFQTIRELAQKIYSFNFDVHILLADAAMAITNGFISVFGNIEKRIVCWSHVERHIKDNLKGIDKNTKSKIKADIVAIQTFTTTSHFSTAWQLFHQKWSNESNHNSSSQLIQNFLTYFSKNWLGEYTCGWYEEYAKGLPSTNNSLESTNNVIKNEGTFRELLPMNEFLSCVQEFITNWSKDRDPKFITTKKFAEFPTVSTHEWTLAFQWVKLDKRIIKINHSENLFYMCTSTEIIHEATKSEGKMYLDSNLWLTFDEYVSFINSIRFVTINTSRWELSICSCPNWNKELLCKHTIGISYKLGLNTFPGLNLHIEANARRGRRKKAYEALQPRTSRGPVNPLMMTQENIDLVDGSVFSDENNQSSEILVTQTTSSLPSGSSITISALPKQAPRKRGRPKKNRQDKNDENPSKKKK
ncbi:unnamed protein product [Brachionus calyciflorus]|uniref:SWIM-type domain-containing protein n=1 Tax=Brachionus calyciflorus TaxID=104777 RepID=A0A813QBP3_9BILA|nr:unnamed protein product [Brachionus calyciflorus]